MSTTTTQTQTDTWVHYHDGGVPGRRRVLKGAAAKETFTALPKIDFQRIYSDSLEDRKELAREVGAACRDIGFFYAVNHGVDETVLEGTFDALKQYFALPTDVKMETHNQKTEKFRGYEAFLEGKLDPSTRGGMLESSLFIHPLHSEANRSLTPPPRPQRRLSHGRGLYRPRTTLPPHVDAPASRPHPTQPMAHTPIRPLLPSRNLPLLPLHVRVQQAHATHLRPCPRPPRNPL